MLNKYSMKYVFKAVLLAVIFFGIEPAFAETEARATASLPKAECPLVETANISVNFNSIESGLSKIKGLLASKISEVETLAKEMGIVSMSLQNSSYNINTNDNCQVTRNSYQFYGSANFTIENSEKAEALMTTLIEKGISANISVNSYRQCE